ncbi:major tail protein [Bacillus safensis]|uniref:major tail protein n=1 Tax=Bacillus safensis TaxID=561879 RepID=UPI003CF5F170
MATTGLRDIRVGVFEDDAAKEAIEVINVPGAIESKLEPSSEIAVLYGDDGVFDQEGSGVGEAKLEINVADLTTEMKNKLLGAELIGGWLEAYGKDTDPPFVALTFRQRQRLFCMWDFCEANSVFHQQKVKQKRIKSNLLRQLLRDNSCPVNLMVGHMSWRTAQVLDSLKGFYDFVFKGIDTTGGDNGTAKAPSSTTTKE